MLKPGIKKPGIAVNTARCMACQRFHLIRLDHPGLFVELCFKLLVVRPSISGHYY